MFPLVQGMRVQHSCQTFTVSQFFVLCLRPPLHTICTRSFLSTYRTPDAESTSCVARQESGHTLPISIKTSQQGLR